MSYDPELDVFLSEDVECPWGCGTPVELDDARLMNSSEGPVVVHFYRCLMGHHWPAPQWEDEQ